MGHAEENGYIANECRTTNIQEVYSLRNEFPYICYVVLALSMGTILVNIIAGLRIFAVRLCRFIHLRFYVRFSLCKIAGPSMHLYDAQSSLKHELSSGIELEGGEGGLVGHSFFYSLIPFIFFFHLEELGCRT